MDREPPLVITHGPAAEVLYEGAQFDVDIGNAGGGAAAKTRTRRKVEATWREATLSARSWWDLVLRGDPPCYRKGSRFRR